MSMPAYRIDPDKFGPVGSQAHEAEYQRVRAVRAAKVVRQARYVRVRWVVAEVMYVLAVVSLALVAGLVVVAVQVLR